jgi:membrane-associated phospholipid phosphatase
MMLESNLLTIVSSGILKKTFHDRRPDGSGFSSFPSGHTAIAFTGAAILDHEYGQQYPWIKWAGYGLATLVGISRIANNRHWASDVLGGAALGIINVDLVYWLNKKKPGHHIHQPLLVP